MCYWEKKKGEDFACTDRSVVWELIFWCFEFARIKPN